MIAKPRGEQKTVPAHLRKKRPIRSRPTFCTNAWGYTWCHSKNRHSTCLFRVRAVVHASPLCMISLIRHLCNALKCEVEELASRIRQNPSRIKKLLSGVPLYYSPSCTSTNATTTTTASNSSEDQEQQQPFTPVRVDGVTKAGVSTLFACGGFLGLPSSSSTIFDMGGLFTTISSSASSNDRESLAVNSTFLLNSSAWIRKSKSLASVKYVD